MDLRDFPEPRVGGKAWPLSTAWLRKLTRMLNALIHIRVQRGNTDLATWSEGGLVIQVKNDSNSSPGSGSSFSLTVRDSSSTVDVSSVDEIVVPDGTLTDDGSGQVTIEFESIYQAQIQSYSAGADYASVKLASYSPSSWSSSGSAFNAALPHLNRQAVKPPSSHGDAVAVLWPDYATDDIVLIGKPIGGTGVEVSSADLEWMILPNKRAWCFEHRICTASTTYYCIIPGWSLTTTSNADFNPVD